MSQFHFCAEGIKKLSFPIYKISSLKHSYAGKTVLRIGDLSIQPASIVGLVGPNGSGKSSLLRLLGLIERPVQGQILFDGRPVEPFSDVARFLITLLPQEPFLMKRSVLSNISYGLRLRGEGKNADEKANAALSLVGLDGKEFARRPWYALSGGETQRVALAARLALKPKVLLLDEPTANVDVASAQLIKEASLKARRELGTTLVIASHDWQWLYEVCDDVLHLVEGKIFGTGHETIIFGPWQELGSGVWGKILSDKQQLRVSAPPDKEKAAVIDALSVCENGSAVFEKDIVLEGTVSRLSLERKTGQIFATILVGDLPFTVGLTPQQSRDKNVFPGKPICIGYRLDQIKWI
jgi:tungstate transport system ATP-binding protein